MDAEGDVEAFTPTVMAEAVTDLTETATIRSMEGQIIMAAAQEVEGRLRTDGVHRLVGEVGAEIHTSHHHTHPLGLTLLRIMVGTAGMAEASIHGHRLIAGMVMVHRFQGAVDHHIATVHMGAMTITEAIMLQVDMEDMVVEAVGGTAAVKPDIMGKMVAAIMADMAVINLAAIVTPVMEGVPLPIAKEGAAEEAVTTNLLTPLFVTYTFFLYTIARNWLTYSTARRTNSHTRVRTPEASGTKYKT